MNYTWGIVITIINVLIMCLLTKCFLRHYTLARNTSSDIHALMKYISAWLLAANLFAFITAIFGYFIYKVESPDLMYFGRTADRYSMSFAFIGFEMLGYKLKDRI